jgi:hypothetical protein
MLPAYQHEASKGHPQGRHLRRRHFVIPAGPLTATFLGIRMRLSRAWGNTGRPTPRRGPTQIRRCRAGATTLTSSLKEDVDRTAVGKDHCDIAFRLLWISALIDKPIS